MFDSVLNNTFRQDPTTNKSLHKKWNFPLTEKRCSEKGSKFTGETAQKMKFSINDFFSKCDQIHSHLLKKSLIENFIFCAVTPLMPEPQK